MTITTQSGFTTEVNENVVDDVRLVRAIQKLQQGDGTAILDVADIILSEKEQEKLFEHISVEGGRVPVGAFGAELTEIITSLRSGKK